MEEELEEGVLLFGEFLEDEIWGCVDDLELWFLWGLFEGGVEGGVEFF